MGIEEFWRLVEAARGSLPPTADGDQVAAAIGDLMVEMSPEEIAAYDQPLWDLMDVSYTDPLWGAAYIVQGGASDDAFDYFRGWLIAQGRAVFERVVAVPDSLADHPAIIAGAAVGEADVEAESMLAVVYRAYRRATGEDVPDGTVVRH